MTSYEGWVSYFWLTSSGPGRQPQDEPFVSFLNKKTRRKFAFMQPSIDFPEFVVWTFWPKNNKSYNLNNLEIN